LLDMNTKVLSVWLWLCVLQFLGSSEGQTTVQFNATQRSWTYQANLTGAFYSYYDEALIVANYSSFLADVWLQFSGSIPANSVITSANLSLTICVSSACSGLSGAQGIIFGLFFIPNNTWNETTITFGNAPVTGYQLVNNYSAVQNGNTSGTTQYWNVTNSPWTQFLQTGVISYMMRYQSGPSGAYLTYYEGHATPNPPFLTVTYVPAPTPAPTPPTPGPTPQPTPKSSTGSVTSNSDSKSRTVVIVTATLAILVVCVLFA